MNLPKFKDQKLFYLAFTHRSYLNETKQKTSSNERLEFLGDSILSFVVSEYLFTTYPDFDEGTLTNLRSSLVNTKTLSKVANELNFGSLLRLSKGEEESKGRENATLLENSFEAFVGALYLDGGMEKASKFLNGVLLIKTSGFAENWTFKDPKSSLQEKVQAQKKNAPVYRVLKEEGPAHARFFTVGVFVGGKKFGQGNGRSKQEAEEQAAKSALEELIKIVVQ